MTGLEEHRIEVTLDHQPFDQRRLERIGMAVAVRGLTQQRDSFGAEIAHHGGHGPRVGRRQWDRVTLLYRSGPDRQQYCDEQQGSDHDGIITAALPLATTTVSLKIGAAKAAAGYDWLSINVIRSRNASAGKSIVST